MIGVVNAGQRLDNLAPGRFHLRVMWLVGLGMFFDSFDNTLSGSVLASMLKSGFSTLELNSIFLSATFFGLAIGAAFAGWLSDRFGRGFAFQFNLALFGILALCCAAAPSMPWLIAIRGIMGIGMGAEYVMCYGLITEFMPPAKRGRYLGMLGIFAGVGVSTTSLLSMFIIPAFSWRAMFVIGGIGTLIVWWLRRSLPESPRWLEAQGRYEEAEAVMQRIEAEAGVVSASVHKPAKAAVANGAPPKWVPITILFSRTVIRRTLLAVILNVTCLFGSYSITGWMPTFFVSQGMSVSKSLGFNAAMMAGYVAGPLFYTFIGDRISRRWAIVMFGTLSAIFAAIYPFLADPAYIVICGFFLVGTVASFLVTGLGATPEFFPTEYRFRGGGVAQTAGRVGLILSPFVILWLFNHYGIGGVIGAISGMYVVVTILMVVAGIDTDKKTVEISGAELDEALPGTSDGVTARQV
ncbi:MFS transporter [Sphingobium bisphenolivorans]|uniref:MFS transporter n=1 Tax=Sphingobium bisphenolivorans TaxID=1335760 RepID=UPI0003B3210E|nr:MFS transporter [Sphingobium bisphenolivorans]